MTVIRHEHQEIAAALVNWFVSQGIFPKDASWTCLNMLAACLADAANNKEHLNEGILMANKLLKKECERMFEERKIS